MGNKSLFLTYVLWLLFGAFGVHHFYLGRDRQAFVWWSTFGGLFLVGWLRDLWRIPSYVDDANEEKDVMEELTRKMKLRQVPPFHVTRFGGEMSVGYFYGILVRLAIPEEAPKSVVALLVPLGIAVGIHLVGNIGREKGGFRYPFVGCFISYLILYYLTGEDVSYMYCALFGSMTFNYFREYRRVKRQRTKCKRLTILSISGLLICSLWCSFFYFNAQITTEDGEKIKLRDSVNHFFKSPAWLEFKETFWGLYAEAQKQGWRNVYDELIKSLDPTGEANALKVLELTEKATESEIRRQYKKLAVKWHPDRNKDNLEQAHKKFIEIQEAYQILSKTMSKRKAHNQRFTNTDRTDF